MNVRRTGCGRNFGKNSTTRNASGRAQAFSLQLPHSLALPDFPRPLPSLPLLFSMASQRELLQPQCLTVTATEAPRCQTLPKPLHHGPDQTAAWARFGSWTIV